ncbi:hypothetical protein TVNIR_0333 [Thioalkalivibrio nitratireducens DSM 14787]|uniref:Uncharacterized protein n=1 Tax=Thioalkalivibrio nitratireducens (strain DSM 14787 / UNIQEM 213 / ALEN2) TaxID=1255043 RepID=L0DUL4_THIND|nr:hypothetical protein [Thioalkalivibrio nitratireducens]AGA32041.1 hypothetical protein TVNIR_0333 [Thioalkalivibrio nitratireducens DSM 14787]
MRIIAVITEALGVRAILPRIAQARGRPEWYEGATVNAIDAEACPAGDPCTQPAPEYEYGYDQTVFW